MEQLTRPAAFASVWRALGQIGSAAPASLLVLLTGPTVALAAVQKEGPLVVGIEDRNWVVRYDSATSARTRIFRASSYVPSVEVSRDGQYIAFREKTAPHFEAPNRLVVIDPIGNEIRVIHKDVHRHTFCCGPDKIAVITGPAREGGIGFVPEHLYAINVRTGEEQEVNGIQYPYRLHWGAFDSSLYIRVLASKGATKVFRYDPSSGELSATAHKGIGFSPDGRYYIFRPTPDRFQIYATEDDDREVTSILPTNVRHLYQARWLPGVGHALLVTEEYYPGRTDTLKVWRRGAPGTPRVKYRHYIVDGETGRMIRMFDGEIAGRWRTNADAIAVEEGGEIRLLRLLGR